MYIGGFVRIELEFNKQNHKINQLESVVESMKEHRKVMTLLKVNLSEEPHKITSNIT